MTGPGNKEVLAIDAGGRGPTAEYLSRLGNGSFEVPRCDSCKRFHFYPRVMCPHCGSNQIVWSQPSGRATVYSTTVVRRRAEDGGDYNVAVIELEEGPRMMSRVEDLPPEAVRIGDAVRARVNGTGTDAVLVFVPLDRTANRG